MHEPSETYAEPQSLHSKEGESIYIASDTSKAFAVQQTRIFKAGNSLAFRIPSLVAREIGVEDGSAVEMAIDKGMLFIRKAVPATQDLANLIERITPENMHRPAFEHMEDSERW